MQFDISPFRMQTLFMSVCNETSLNLGFHPKDCTIYSFEFQPHALYQYNLGWHHLELIMMSLSLFFISQNSAHILFCFLFFIFEHMTFPILHFVLPFMFFTPFQLCGEYDILQNPCKGHAEKRTIFVLILSSLFFPLYYLYYLMYGNNVEYGLHA